MTDFYIFVFFDLNVGVQVCYWVTFSNGSYKDLFFK